MQKKEKKKTFQHNPFRKLKIEFLTPTELPSNANTNQKDDNRNSSKCMSEINNTSNTENDYTNKENFLSDEKIFELAMNGVVPVEAPLQAPKIVRAKPIPLQADEDYLVMQELDELIHGNKDFDFADTEEYIEASRSDLDKRIVKKLRKGDFAFQAYLDLHGMNREQARSAVGEFIKKSYLESKRCILIVHGRGLKSKNNLPILKTKLAAWLTRGSIGKKVLAYTSALPHDGGTGAIYVLLSSS